MILDLVKMLQSAAVGMMDGSVLGPKEGYEQASSFTFGLTLNTLAESLDGAADSLHEENDALRAIFVHAEGLGLDDALRERLVAAAGEGDASLRVSALLETNHSLRSLLIDLHAAVEEHTSPAARDLEDSIWRELGRSTERRRVALGPF